MQIRVIYEQPKPCHLPTRPPRSRMFSGLRRPVLWWQVLFGVVLGCLYDLVRFFFFR